MPGLIRQKSEKERNLLRRDINLGEQSVDLKLRLSTIGENLDEADLIAMARNCNEREVIDGILESWESTDITDLFESHAEKLDDEDRHTLLKKIITDDDDPADIFDIVLPETPEAIINCINDLSLNDKTLFLKDLFAQLKEDEEFEAMEIMNMITDAFPAQVEELDLIPEQICEREGILWGDKAREIYDYLGTTMKVPQPQVPGESYVYKIDKRPEVTVKGMYLVDGVYHLFNNTSNLFNRTTKSTLPDAFEWLAT